MNRPQLRLKMFPCQGSVRLHITLQPLQQAPPASPEAERTAAQPAIPNLVKLNTHIHLSHVGVSLADQAAGGGPYRGARGGCR